jgi:hypothetical protein
MHTPWKIQFIGTCTEQSGGTADCHWCSGKSPQVWVDGNTTFENTIGDAAIQMWDSGPLNMHISETSESQANVWYREGSLPSTDAAQFQQGVAASTSGCWQETPSAPQKIWWNSAYPQPTWENDVTAVAHEFGHSLGLAHDLHSLGSPADQLSALMYPGNYYTFGPTYDDWAGIFHYYSNPDWSHWTQPYIYGTGYAKYDSNNHPYEEGTTDSSNSMGELYDPTAHSLGNSEAVTLQSLVYPISTYHFSLCLCVSNPNPDTASNRMYDLEANTNGFWISDTTASGTGWYGNVAGSNSLSVGNWYWVQLEILNNENTGSAEAWGNVWNCGATACGPGSWSGSFLGSLGCSQQWDSTHCSSPQQIQTAKYSFTPGSQSFYFGESAFNYGSTGNPDSWIQYNLADDWGANSP